MNRFIIVLWTLSLIEYAAVNHCTIATTPLTTSLIVKLYYSSSPAERARAHATCRENSCSSE